MSDISEKKHEEEEAVAQAVAEDQKYWIHIIIDRPRGNEASTTPDTEVEYTKLTLIVEGEHPTPTEDELKSWVDSLKNHGAANGLINLYLGKLQQYEKVLYKDDKYLLKTQAGCHKCKRIYSKTGKLCQTSFSRPHDLTRHKDTIHNACKQNMQCNVCKDKTFSCANALTRYYCVCYPDLKRDSASN